MRCGRHQDQDVSVYNEWCVFGEPRTALGPTFLVCKMLDEQVPASLIHWGLPRRLPGPWLPPITFEVFQIFHSVKPSAVEVSMSFFFFCCLFPPIVKKWLSSDR